MINNKFLLVLAMLLLVIALTSVASASNPNGADVVNRNSTAAAPSAASSDNAIAGNVTDLDISGISTTQSWQGYFGNVTGVIQLADGSNNVLYNWTQANPLGQVYASTNNTIYWTNVQCFNYTANGSYNNEAGNGGTTNLYGTNLTQLQAMFNIAAGDADTVNSTFDLIGTGTHNQFYTANQQFTEGMCPNTRVYDNTGAGVANKFEEALLYEPVSSSVVFASLLNQDVNGFDQKTHDFEMLVLEDGHNSDVSTTPYYFFVELQ